jgi:hypothetical protein
MHPIERSFGGWRRAFVTGFLRRPLNFVFEFRYSGGKAPLIIVAMLGMFAIASLTWLYRRWISWLHHVEVQRPTSLIKLSPKSMEQSSASQQVSSSSTRLCGFCEQIIAHQNRSLRGVEKGIAYLEVRHQLFLVEQIADCDLCNYVWSIFQMTTDYANATEEEKRTAKIVRAVCMPIYNE